MALSNDLISQFVKVTKDDTKTSNETTVYGTVVYDGRTYVKLDGAPEGVLTPVSSVTNVKDGERVTVLIKDHTATVTGNISSPSARTTEVEEVSDQMTAIWNNFYDGSQSLEHYADVMTALGASTASSTDEKK